MAMRASIIPCVLISACAFAADTPRAPAEWVVVHTNEIARWKERNSAPDGVAADIKTRTVRALAEATGVGTGEPVEFLAVGPLSDRAYETMFVTVASPAAIAAALDATGLPRGTPPSVTAARLWPQGEKVKVSAKRLEDGKAFSLDGMLTDSRSKDEGAVLDIPVAFTGGERDAADTPLAVSNMPCAVFALYTHAPSLLQLDGTLDQSSTYGRFSPAVRFGHGELFEISVSWDGRRTVLDRVVTLSATNAAAQMAALAEEAKTYDVFVHLAFDDTVTIARAAELARAFSALDGKGIKLNGAVPGHFFSRAFLPDPAWRERPGRIFQPFEVRVAKDGSKTFTFVEEDWSGDGIDPALKPRTTSFGDWSELKGLIARTGDQGAKVSVVFLFAPSDMAVTRLTPVVAALSPRIDTFYIFAEHH